jgi:hypothetical protein
MYQQTNFLDQPLPPTITPRRAIPGESIEQQFRAFHAANPHVYNALRSLALGMVKQSRRRIGMRMLLEVLRWQYYMQTNDPSSDFKINNNYAPHYARLLMDSTPELAGAFEVREIRTP